MKNLRNYLIKTFIATFVLIAFAGISNAQSATNLVANLYKAHQKKSIATWKKAELRKYFTAEFTDLFYKVANQEYGIGADPLFDTQDDSDIKNIKFTTEKAVKNSNGQTSIRISANFKNFGTVKKVILTIDPKTNKIKDINYKGQKESLMDMLKD